MVRKKLQKQKTAAAADEVSGITQAEPENRGVRGSQGTGGSRRRPSWQRNLQEKRFTGYSESDYNVLLPDRFRRKPENCDMERTCPWWQT